MRACSFVSKMRASHLSGFKQGNGILGQAEIAHNSEIAVSGRALRLFGRICV